MPHFKEIVVSRGLCIRLKNALAKRQPDFYRGYMISYNRLPNGVELSPPPPNLNPDLIHWLLRGSELTI